MAEDLKSPLVVRDDRLSGRGNEVYRYSDDLSKVALPASLTEAYHRFAARVEESSIDEEILEEYVRSL